MTQWNTTTGMQNVANLGNLTGAGWQSGNGYVGVTSTGQGQLFADKAAFDQYRAGSTPATNTNNIGLDANRTQANSVRTTNNTGVIPTSQNPATNPNIGSTWGDVTTNGAQPLTPQLPQQPTGLTLADLNNWWTGIQSNAPWQQQANTTTGSPTSIGQLFPRANWGNYQTSNRGGRYFDATSGRYQGLGDLQPAQTASL